MTIMRQFTRCTFNMSVMFNRFKIAHCLFRTKASIFTRQTDTRTNDGIDTIVHKIPFECTKGQYWSKYAITFNKNNELNAFWGFDQTSLHFQYLSCSWVLTYCIVALVQDELLYSTVNAIHCWDICIVKKFVFDLHF